MGPSPSPNQDGPHLKLWITDFGLARMEQDAGMTMTGDLLGTLRYMSPEQVLAKRVVVDHRSDIYSLGVTLYELITLQPAYAATDREELLRQIAFEEPRKTRQINSRIPQDLETIILKAIEKNPIQRYATAHDLADDLRCFLDHEPVKAKPPSWRNRVTKWSRRHPVAVRATASTALVSAAVVAASIGWTLRDRQAQQALASTTADLVASAARLVEVGRYDEAIKAANEAIRLKPNLAEGYYNLGIALFANGSLDPAIVNFREAVRLRPSLADAHFRLGVVLQEKGMLNDAIASYEEHLRLKPTATAALNNLSVLYGNTGREDDEIAQYRELIKRAPDFATAHSNLGSVLYRRGQPDEAISSLREAIRLDPADPFAYSTIGRIYFDKGKFANAIPFLKAAILLRPDPDFNYYNPYEHLEIALNSTRDMKAVADFYQEAIFRQPDVPALHLRYAAVLRRQGDAHGADQAEQTAIRLYEREIGDPRTFGEYYAAAGRYAEAALYYTAAHHDSPDDAPIALRAGFLLFFTGNRPGYEAICREMLDRFPSTGDPDRIRRVCWLCLLSDPPYGRLDEHVRWAEFVCERASGVYGNLLALRERGLAAYRAQDCKGALKWCAESRALLSDRDDYRAQNLFVEAMATRRLADVPKAVAIFDEAVQAMQRSFPNAETSAYQSYGLMPEWIDYMYCELLRREAEALIKPSIDTGVSETINERSATD
jgi:tetratricopeptide (TPR) repeat protein